MLQIMGLSTCPRESYTKYTKCIQVYLGVKVNTTQWKYKPFCGKVEDGLQGLSIMIPSQFCCSSSKLKPKMLNIPLTKLRITVQINVLIML